VAIFLPLSWVFVRPESMVLPILRVIRSVRGLNMTNGFNFLLHPFINVSEAIFEDQDP
jgi:hypothetical protein